MSEPRPPEEGSRADAGEPQPAMHDMTQQVAGAIERAPARVWLFQPTIQHYRIPVWDRLIERGAGVYELTVIGPLDDGEAFGGGSRPYFRAGDARRHTVPLAVWTWPGAVRSVLRERPDVVMMASNPRNLSCWRLRHAARRVGAPLVAWSKVHSYSGAPDWLMRPIKRRFFRAMDRVICYGECSRDELRSLGVPDAHIRVAQNTIDTSRIFEEGDRIRQKGRRLRESAGLTDRTVLLCVGRMDAEKRHDDLLESWPALREVEPDLALVLVGSGPLFEKIRSRAAEIDPHHIVLTGRVPEGDDYAWIAAADICVYPGAVGLAINQSLALGCPTMIADERGADSEILRDGVTGWRFPKGDRQRLVATVASILEDREKTSEIVGRARRLMREDVTIGRMVDVIDAAIRDAVELGQARRHPAP